MRGSPRCALFLALWPLMMPAVGFYCIATEAQIGEWTLMGGGDTQGQPGI